MKIVQRFAEVDWILFLATVPLIAVGLVGMRSLGGGNDYYFTRQLFWIGVSVFVFFVFSVFDRQIS